MASRVNTRFLIILAVVGVTVVAIVGGLLYIKNRTDVTGSLKRGDEFMAQGEYVRARSYYTRALSSDPGNLAYLENVRRALLAMQPETGDIARELYANYINVLRHAAEHHPSDVAQHLPLLEELHQAARRSSSWQYSEHLEDSAENMLTRASESHPEYLKGKLYRGIAHVSPWMVDRLSDTEVAAGEEDIKEYLAAFPESDTGWAYLVTARSAALDRLRKAGQATRADEKERELGETLRSGHEQVGEGPQFLTAALLAAVAQHQRDPKKVDREQVRRDMEKLARVITEVEDSTTVSEAALAVERIFWEKDKPDPIRILSEHLDQQPDAHDVRLLRATLLYYDGKLDESDADSNVIIESPLLPVGFLSQLQFEIQKRARSLRVDTAVRRWDLSDETDDQNALMAAIEKSLTELEAVIVDTESDPLLIRARGQIAFVRRDYGLAAALFNRLVSAGVGVDYRTRLYAALSLERQGELGAAVDMLSQANFEQPGNTIAMLHEGQLRLRMGQYEEATALADAVLEIDDQNEQAHLLKLTIEQQKDPTGRTTTDPLREAMANATALFRAGEYDAARSTIQAELSKTPNDLSLLNGMVRIEIASGRMDDARKYVDHALVVSPKSRTFLTYKANLDNPDPIGAIEQYMRDLYSDETERAVETLLAFSALRMRYERDLDAARTASDSEQVTELTNSLARLNQKETVFRAKAEQLAPENPRLIEYRFMKSVQAKDWPAVEQVISVAQRLNSDQAGGALYRGRYEAALDNPEEAARMFQLATEQIPYSAMAWRMLALAKRFLGDYQGALRAFQSAYANNPADITTVGEYAKLLNLTGNQTRALIVIRQGRRLAPTNAEIRELWLGLEAAAGEPRTVLSERRKRYEQNPEDKKNAAALADFLGRTKPKRELILDDKGQEVYSFDRWTRLPGVGRGSAAELIAQEERKWWAEADVIVEDLAPPGERRLDWHLLRSGLLRARGDVQGGEDVLRAWAAKQSDPEEQVDAMVALGLYQSGVDRTAEAIASFEMALEIDAESKHKAHLALGETYFRQGRYAEAISQLEAVTAFSPSRQLDLQIIESYIKTGQVQKARELLAEAEARDQPDGTSIMLRASIAGQEADQLWQEGEREAAEQRYAEHLESLQLAAKVDPTNPMPHVLQAVAKLAAYRRTGNAVLLDDALRALTRADDVRPEFVQTSLTRVKVLQEKKDPASAISELTRLLERSPGQNDARRQLVQLLMLEGRDEAAIEVVRAAVEYNPSTVFWVVALADLHVSEQRKAERTLRALPPNALEARTLRAQIKRLSESVEMHYRSAIELTPAPRLIAKRAEILLANDPPDYEPTIKLIEEHAKLVEDSPTLRTLYARALARTGKLAQALEHMEIAYVRFRELIRDELIPPQNIEKWYQELFEIHNREAARTEEFARKTAGEPDAYELRAIGNIWAMGGVDGLSRAIEVRTKAIAMAPEEDVRLRTDLHADLAGAMVLTKQHRDALAEYKKALDLDPGSGVTLNNIAYIYSEFLGEPESGLPYAQKAAELLPMEAGIMDTLGFIYFRMDKTELAESYLRRASQLQATAENQMHMGALFHKKGDYALARRYLAKAAELNPTNEIREEINRLADDIRTKTENRQ